MVLHQQNAEMVSGDSAVIVVAITDEDGTAIPMTEVHAATYKLAKTVLQTALLTKAIGQGIVLPPSTIASITGDITLEDNEIAVLLDPADTATLAGKYFHELRLTDSSANVGTVMTGRLRVLRSLGV